MLVVGNKNFLVVVCGAYYNDDEQKHTLKKLTMASEHNELKVTGIRERMKKDREAEKVIHVEQEQK